jgi:transposase InsO family protein
MRENKIIPKTKLKFRITTNSNHSHTIAPNLVRRNFALEKRNKVWVGDITYIWTREGWLYLSTVIDLFSRKIVGWSLESRMSRKLVMKSLSEAISQRKPEQGLIFHSDQGSQYASNEFRTLIKNNGALPSMSRRGNCWDNAVAESFFKTIKSELIYDGIFSTKQEARLAIFDYIEIFYNRKRLHSTINYMSPHDYEKFVVA